MTQPEPSEAGYFSEQAPAQGAWVRAQPNLVVPPSCACCGAVAAGSLSEKLPAQHLTLIIPYCTDCQHHVAARRTRQLAVGIASGVLGLSAAALLVLAWSQMPLLVYVGASLSLAGLPLLLLLRTRSAEGHAARGRAAQLTRAGLYCKRLGFAQQLAAANGLELDPSPPPRNVPWVASGCLLTLLALPAAWWLHHPSVRILNLGDSRMEVFLDGRPLVAVEPSSAETPLAGAELRIPVGRHVLSAKNSSGLTSVNVELSSGSEHLFAPFADDYCFWLETSTYGRQQESRKLHLLRETRPFWSIDEPVDLWFAPTPRPDTADERSSGGSLTALRQARCVEAPAAVQRQ